MIENEDVIENENVRLSKAVFHFVGHAVKSGSRNSKYYYKNFHDLKNLAINSINKNDQESIRHVVEDILIAAIEQGVEEKCYYKDIYQEAKKDILKFIERNQGDISDRTQ